MNAMGWQDAAVFVVVAAAVAFLILRNVSFRRRQRKPVETFIPLSAVRRSPRPPDDEQPACH